MSFGAYQNKAMLDLRNQVREEIETIKLKRMKIRPDNQLIHLWYVLMRLDIIDEGFYHRPPIDYSSLAKMYGGEAVGPKVISVLTDDGLFLHQALVYYNDDGTEARREKIDITEHQKRLDSLDI